MRDQSHYEVLGVDMFTSSSEIQTAVERLSRRANAIANTDPERSRAIREQIRRIKEDLLSGEERRNAYDRQILTGDWPNDVSNAPVSHWKRSASDRGPESSGRGAPGLQQPAQTTQTRRQQRDSRRYWFAAIPVLLMLAVAGGVFAAGHFAVKSAAVVTVTPLASPTLVPSSTPQPTALPTATSTAVGGLSTEIRGAIVAALHRSNRAFVSSMACACDQGLEAAKTGADLQTYLSRIQTMQSQGQHEDITTNSFDILSIKLDNPTSATALVRKGEMSKVYIGSTLSSSCALPYVVKYHLVDVGGDWKVDGTQLPNGYPCA